MREAKEIYEEVARRTAQGETVALATIVRTKGSTPREVGAKMVIVADGKTKGTIGGGCGEADVWQEAKDVIRTGRPKLVRVDLTADLAADRGDVCGGIMEVFVEAIGPVPVGSRR